MNGEQLPPIRYGRIDCMGSIEKAIDHTKRMLFQKPFDLNKWISLGVIIFLSILGSGGGGGISLPFPNTGGGGFGGAGGGGGPSFAEFVDEARDWVAENLATILFWGGIIFAIVAVLTVVFAWLGARGRLMFVRAVALDDCRIGVNWSETAKLSSSLFWFTLALIAASWILFFAIAALGVAAVVFAADSGAQTLMEYFNYVAWPLILMLVYIGVLIPVLLLLNDFVVPVMYRFNVPVMTAWRIVFGMFSGNFLTLTLFYVIRFVIGIVKGFAIMFAACVTCFMGALPVVSQALTAPIHVFDRAFSMYALESMGPDFEMIRPMTIQTDPFDNAPRDGTGY